jgi:hypothetical protein
VKHNKFRLMTEASRALVAPDKNIAYEGEDSRKCLRMFGWKLMYEARICWVGE